jgi:hypothetical protein
LSGGVNHQKEGERRGWTRGEYDQSTL